MSDKFPTPGKTRCLAPADFRYDTTVQTCVCPAGKSLYGNGSNCVINGRIAVKFQGARQDCEPCALRSQCLRTPENTRTRQVAFFQGRAPGHETPPTG